MTELDVSNITNTPSLVGPVQARMSEELALRLQVLKSTASAPMPAAPQASMPARLETHSSHVNADFFLLFMRSRLHPHRRHRAWRRIRPT